MDFEQFPITQAEDCPVFPYDRGALFSGGTIQQLETDPINPTKVYRSVQPVFGGFLCYANPMVISFDEPTSNVGLDLYAPNRFITVQDDSGWSRTIDFLYEATEWGPSSDKVHVTIPSSGIREITIHDPCRYFGECGKPWSFHIDNVAFRPVRPCLAIAGPSEVEPNDARQTTKYIALVVEVTDCEGNPMSGVAVETTVDVVHTSGGHLDDHPTPTPRPLGGLREHSGTASGAGTDSVTLSSNADGQILLQVVPPEVAGTHIIDATCVDTQCTEPDPPHHVDVKIAGLAPIPRFDVYYTLTEYLPGTIVGKNIGDNGRHDGVNHWLTPEASEVLWRIAFHYAELLDFQPDPERLHVNDASLPWGGLFDILGQWRPSHHGHRKGTVVDIRANQLPGAVPPDHDQEFLDAAGKLGARAVREKVGSPSEHYHLMLRGVYE